LASGFLFFISELSGGDLMPEILQEIEDGRPEKNDERNRTDDKKNGQTSNPDSNFGKRLAALIVMANLLKALYSRPQSSDA
jgi:hypothetical protein